MNGTYRLDEVVAKFRAEGRIAIVGASLAGLRAAEALRDKGFEGSLTIIGDEPHATRFPVEGRVRDHETQLRPLGMIRAQCVRKRRG